MVKRPNAPQVFTGPDMAPRAISKVRAAGAVGLAVEVVAASGRTTEKMRRRENRQPQLEQRPRTDSPSWISGTTGSVATNSCEDFDQFEPRTKCTRGESIRMPRAN